jgi:hypothetical protein
MYCHLSLLIVLTSLLTVSASSPAAADAQPANLPTEIHHSPFAIRHLQQAAHYYNRYNALAPDDLLGLKRLTETCTALEEAGVEDENCIAAAEQVEADNIIEKQGHSSSSAALRNTLEKKLTQGLSYYVGQVVFDEWVLAGYGLSEKSLEQTNLFSIWLYWLPPQSASTTAMKKKGWNNAGGYWIEIIEGRNLIIDGAFETRSVGNGIIPVGFQTTYDAPLDSYQIVVDERDERNTKCVRLQNGDEYKSSGLWSWEIPVDDDGIYLQGGWIRAEKGAAHLGRRWELRDGRGSYSYTARGISPQKWTHFAEVVAPLDDSVTCRVWLLNVNAKGSVYFDNVVFIKLSHPLKARSSQR